MKRFELLDISGDAGIMAFGRNIEELFENAAAAMYSLITGMDSVQEKEVVDITVEKDSLDGLLVAWLNELIFRFDVDGFIAKKVVITGLSGSLTETRNRNGGPLELKASLSGEEFDPDRHESRLLLKAATYHDLRIEKKGDVWQGRIVFDI